MPRTATPKKRKVAEAGGQTAAAAGGDGAAAAAVKLPTHRCWWAGRAMIVLGVVGLALQLYLSSGGSGGGVVREDLPVANATVHHMALRAAELGHVRVRLTSRLCVSPA